jgi:hypothetical protein
MPRRDNRVTEAVKTGVAVEVEPPGGRKPGAGKSLA